MVRLQDGLQRALLTFRLIRVHPVLLPGRRPSCPDHRVRGCDMKIQYFIRHPEFDGLIRVSRSEYNLLKSKAGSKSTGYEAYTDSYPDLPVESNAITDYPTVCRGDPGLVADYQ